MSEALKRYGAEAAELQKKKTDLEIELKSLDEKLKDLTEVKIPEELLVLGLQKVTLDNGVNVALERKFYGGIPNDKGSEAVQLLRNNGYLFNFAVSAPVLPETVDAAMEALRALNIVPKAKPDIHPQTWKKICRELDDAGVFDEQAQQTMGAVMKITAAVKIND